MEIIKSETVEVVEKCTGPSLALDCMFEELANTPPPQYIFRGIVHPSFGVIFGPAKSGKTIITENILFSIAAQQASFLGEKLYSPNSRVLLVSLEEFDRNRTARNKKQFDYLTEKYQLDPDWVKNIIVVDGTFPRYFYSDKEWDLLERTIESQKPSVVMIDSLTRLTTEQIEESTVATKVMKRLREIANKHQITLIVIHHTQKMDNRPLTIASLAGSRVVGQECDFMVGINKTSEGIRYLKDVAYRYASDDAENVLKFRINDSLVVENAGYSPEAAILASEDRTPRTGSDEMVIDHFIFNPSKDKSGVFQLADIKKALVENGKMSKPTLHAALKRLAEKGDIEQTKKGEYRLAG